MKTLDIKLLQTLLSDYDDISFAYLFGSFAKGTQTNSSDVDIAISFDNQTVPFDRVLHIHHQLEIQLQREIDLVNLNTAKNLFLLRDILQKHIVLKNSADDARALFELQKHHEILDFMHFKSMADVA